MRESFVYEEGKREKWIYESFKKNFDRNNCLLRLSEEIKKLSIESSVEHSSKAVLCFLFSQLRNTCKSIEILCRHGYPQQAYVLLRSLQEGYLHINYILQKGRDEALAKKKRAAIESELGTNAALAYLWALGNVFFTNSLNYYSILISTSLHFLTWVSKYGRIRQYCLIKSWNTG